MLVATLFKLTNKTITKLCKEDKLSEIRAMYTTLLINGEQQKWLTSNLWLNEACECTQRSSPGVYSTTGQLRLERTSGDLQSNLLLKQGGV